MKKPYFVYMLRCRDASLYTGIAVNPQKRLADHEHSPKRGSKYTWARRPLSLVYVQRYSDKGTALRREYKIKQLTKAQKEQLIIAREFHIRKK